MRVQNISSGRTKQEVPQQHNKEPEGTKTPSRKEEPAVPEPNLIQCESVMATGGQQAASRRPVQTLEESKVHPEKLLPNQEAPFSSESLDWSGGSGQGPITAPRPSFTFQLDYL